MPLIRLPLLIERARYLSAKNRPLFEAVGLVLHFQAFDRARQGSDVLSIWPTRNPAPCEYCFNQWEQVVFLLCLSLWDRVGRVSPVTVLPDLTLITPPPGD